MAKDLVRAFRDIILLAVEKIFAVGRPFGRSNSLDLVCKYLAGLQVFELQSVLTITRRVGRKCQPIPVVADLECSDRKVFRSLCHLVLIEQNFCVDSVAGLASEICRILFAFFGLIEVPIVSDPRRHAKVGLLDPAEHLLIERIGKRLVLAHKALGVLILSVQIVYDRRIFILIAITHPRIVIRDLITMNLQNLWNFLCNRWFHILRNDHELADHDDDE